MSLHRLIFALALIPTAIFADDCNVKGTEKDAPVLCGRAVQGGFLYGESDWRVANESQAACDSVHCAERSDGGVFVIGIPMDAKENLKLRFCKDDVCRNFTYKIKQRKYAEQKLKVDDKFVHYPPEVEKRIDAENKRFSEARAPRDRSFIGFMDWKYPFAKKYPMTGEYGSRRVFNGVPKSPHKGVDMAAPKGTPVRSIGAGRVALTIDAYMSGKTVVVSHGFGIFSLYAHLDKINVKKGDAVETDSVIGNVGATGRASGPHLHLGLYFNNAALDPALLF